MNNYEGFPKSVVPENVQQQSQLPAAVTPASVTGTPRRSTRAGRGENPKYKDYVSSMSCRNKYVQEYPALRRGEASLVVRPNLLL